MSQVIVFMYVKDKGILVYGHYNMTRGHQRYVLIKGHLYRYDLIGSCNLLDTEDQEVECNPSHRSSVLKGQLFLKNCSINQH